MDHVDFLPERIRAHRRRRRLLVRQGALIGVVAASLVVLGTIRSGRIASARAELGLLTERASGVERQLAMRDRLEKEQADLLVKKRIDDQLGSRVGTLDVLAEIGRLLPESICLTDLNLEKVELRVPVSPAAGARPATAKRRDRKIQRMRLLITGVAPTDVDVANFIGQVSASPFFEDVNMGFSRPLEFRGRTGREFQASCYVVK